MRGVVVVVVVVVGPARKKASDHGRTDQLEDRNIILNSKLILVSNDYQTPSQESTNNRLSKFTRIDSGSCCCVERS